MTDSRFDQRDTTADRLLKALAHADRRAVLAELSAHDGAAIAVDVLSGRLESVPETELYHRHLPVLDEAGVLAFDPERERVEYTPTAGVIEILGVVDDRFE